MKKLYNFLLAVVVTLFTQTVNAQADSLDIYPNPFQDSCTIVLNSLSNDTVSLEIYNMWGEVVKNFHTNDVLSGDLSYQFQADTLPQGHYIVSYIVNGEKQMYRVTKINATGIWELKSESPSFLIYPNPAQDYIQFELPLEYGNQLYTYQILSSDGKVVSRGNQIAKRIDIQDIPKGNYLLRVNQDNGEKFTSRFVVE